MMSVERLVFIDEFAVNTAMTRTHARAPRGERAEVSEPGHHGPNISVLSALSLSGVSAMMTIEGAVDSVLAARRHGAYSFLTSARTQTFIQRYMETLEQRIRRVTQEDVAITPYDPRWPELFRQEKGHLLNCLPNELIRRIEHFGSTAVPGLAAKPIVDILVEVTDLQMARTQIAPLLESQGYDYFWRPKFGDDGPPFYAWFIKRQEGSGLRTHHIHMVERHFVEHWDRLLFRDYLIEHPRVAEEYQNLKLRLASAYPNDRVAYTRGKTEFVLKVTAMAKQFYG